MATWRTLGVVGAGTMGAGIAQVAAQAGLQTLLCDLSEERSRAAVDQVRKDLDVGVTKGKVTVAAREATLAKLSTARELSQLAACDAVIEAVPEDLALKQRVFAGLSAALPKTALLASNTSSLSLTELAGAVLSPDRLVGMHFFNPVPRMKLVELVKAYQTSAETVGRARDLAGLLGKEVVEVNDHPGFASTRLGIALGMEAIRMVEAGVAAPADIDRAMRLGYGHPLGPLELTDLVGLDVRLAIAEYLHRELGSESFRPPQLLKKMVRAGKLGKKSGSGFYNY